MYNREDLDTVQFGDSKMENVWVIGQRDEYTGYGCGVDIMSLKNHY